MKTITYIVTLFALTALGFSCQKEDPQGSNDQPEEKTMNITIQSPQTSSTFAYNENVTIQGVINSNFDAHGYIVRYYNTTNNDSLLYEKDGHEHGEDISFSVSWTNNLEIQSDVRIEVTAVSDHQGTYTETKEVSVTCLPQ